MLSAALPASFRARHSEKIMRSDVRNGWGFWNAAPHVPVALSSHYFPLTMRYTGPHILVWDFGLPLIATSLVFLAVSRC
jgi:hypothetical protein